jgi:hypothetical protein
MEKRGEEKREEEKRIITFFNETHLRGRVF